MLSNLMAFATPHSILERNVQMKSFLFLLVTAAAVGALAGTILHPGAPEIVIVWAALIGLFYGVRSLRSARRTAAT